MKILYFQSVGGASGDMILAAFSALGVDMEEVERAVNTLTDTVMRIRAAPASSHGLHGVRVDVSSAESGAPLPHRTLRDIGDLIRAGDLADAVRARAERVFQRLAEAEAEVHHTTPDRIHFHEVGALDSIADIVGSCVALELLGVDAVAVAPLPLGCGTVECAHGTYPTPAPATALLLRGVPVIQTDEPYELVTPTAAALLTTWQSHVHVPPGSCLAKVGYGFGHRTLDRRPNLLRAMLFEDAAGAEGDTCLVLECQVDDTTPELVGHLTGTLLENGAIDVFTTGVLMKKQRPGTLITVLCRPDDREAMLDRLFRESTTFGVRESTTRRTTLPRRVETVDTSYGPVRVKIGAWRGEDVTVAPEMDDCVARAAEAGVAARAVYEAACRVRPHSPAPGAGTVQGRSATPVPPP